jgi:hypothetical protein
MLKECKLNDVKTYCNSYNGRNKKGRTCKGWTDEVGQNLKIMGIKKQAGIGHRPSGIEENCIESE